MPENESIAAPVDPSLCSAKLQGVIVHPLVLLSAVDHFSRMSKGKDSKRVAGVLLGTVRQNGQVIDISNSFAVPFDEDKDVWFLDEDYLDSMWQMFRKVNARERIVGWYHTGPKLCPSDIAITERFQTHFQNAVLVIVDTTNDAAGEKVLAANREKYVGSPIATYRLTEEVHSDGTPTTKTFDQVPSTIEAEEAEEVGVEHLLRDIRGTRGGTLSQRIMHQVHAVRGFHQSIQQMSQYVDSVLKKRLPYNQLVIQHIQNVMNCLNQLIGIPPNEIYVKESPTVNERQLSVLNDQMGVIFVSVVCRTVIALHVLINNKLQNRQSEKQAALTAAAAVSHQSSTSSKHPTAMSSTERGSKSNQGK